MKLSVKYQPGHNEHIQGFYIPGTSLRSWLEVLDDMQLDIAELSIYPLPGAVANSVWGCFVWCKRDLELEEYGSYLLGQCIDGHVIIPQDSILHPRPEKGKLAEVLHAHLSIYHPQIGFYMAEEALDISRHIGIPAEIKIDQLQSIPDRKPPYGISRYLVKTPENQDVAKNLRESVLGKDTETDKEFKPLSPGERINLLLLKLLFGKKKRKSGARKKSKRVQAADLPKWMSFLFSRKGILDTLQKWMEKMDELEFRNQRSYEKLMAMFERDPEKALLYALPISQGSRRGANSASSSSWKFERRRKHLTGDFEIRRGGASVDVGDQRRYKLEEQYRKTAKQLREKGKFKEAAYIYSELLDTPGMAGVILQEGGFYEEAASFHLKQKDYGAAAICFEKARNYEKALDYHERSGQFRRAGDLFLKHYKPDSDDPTQTRYAARLSRYYNRHIEQLKNSNQFYAAVEFAKENKYNTYDPFRMLKERWIEKPSQLGTCLRLYLNFRGPEQEFDSIKDLYRSYFQYHNTSGFVRALTSRLEKNRESENLPEFLFEITASQLQRDPDLVDVLNRLRPHDRELWRDVHRFVDQKTFRKK